MEKKKNDIVNRPQHYIAGEYECSTVAREIINECDMPGWVSCLWYSAFQYLWRAFRKNGVEDLRKAVWYINRLIEYMEG